MKIAELRAEAEFMEKKRMVDIEIERLHIQEKVAKALAKFKIYEDLHQMSQRAGKIKMQEEKGNGEHHLRHAQAVADKKTNCYNKNQATVSFLHQRNVKAVDDKGKKSDLRKSTNNGFGARCMETKLRSRYSGNPRQSTSYLLIQNKMTQRIFQNQEMMKTEMPHTVESVDNATK